MGADDTFTQGGGAGKRLVGLVHDERFLEHRDPAGGHPERPERLRACAEALQAAGQLEGFVRCPLREATDDELVRVHEMSYLRALDALRGRSGYLDADTFVAPASVELARLAVGAVIDLVRAVDEGQLAAGLALVRPPGHHAERARAGGFCLLSTVAVAAADRVACGRRVAIVDFDVHHGNGTQQAFYDDDRVLFISLHRHGAGFYPGSGAPEERGHGRGRGFTVNVGLPKGTTSGEWLRAFDEHAGPSLERFAPDVLLVSAGFDAHARDPLGDARVDDAGFLAIGQRLRDAAALLCGGRWVAVLEGGYDLEALATGVVNLAACLGVEREARGATSSEPPAVSRPRSEVQPSDQPTREARGATRATKLGES